MIASAIGGITDQITDGVDGLLLPDPGDLDAFANTLAGLFYDDEEAGWGKPVEPGCTTSSWSTATSSSSPTGWRTGPATVEPPGTLSDFGRG